MDAAAELDSLRPLLVRGLKRRFGQCHDWEDICQEGLIAAWFALRERPEYQNRAGLAVQAAYHGACRYFARRRGETEPYFLFAEEPERLVSPAPGPEELALAALARREWERLIRSCCAAHYADAVIRVYLDEWGTTDYARSVAVSVGSMACRVRRGLEAVRTELGVIPEGRRARQDLSQRGGNALKSHCPRGHEYTPENILWQQHRRGTRRSLARKCRTCVNAAARRRLQERKQAEQEAGECSRC